VVVSKILLGALRNKNRFPVLQYSWNYSCLLTYKEDLQNGSIDYAVFTSFISLLILKHFKIIFPL